MRYSLILACLLFALPAGAQKYRAQKAVISFFSHAAIEDIKADNEKANSIFNGETGEIAFVVPIHDFEFAKSLMKEHFNEKYLETEKFPKATFQGKLSGYQLSVQGQQQVSASGKLTIHGITRDVEIPGTLEWLGKELRMQSKFVVKLEDYQIPRPQLLWQNIAEQVEVTVDFTFKPYEK